MFSNFFYLLRNLDKMSYRRFLIYHQIQNLHNLSKNYTVYDLGGNNNKKELILDGRNVLDNFRVIKVNLDSSTNPDILGSIEDLPIKNNKVQNIICLETIQYIQNIDLVMSEIYRILKSGGNLIITFPFILPELSDYTDRNRFTLKLIKEITKKFSIVKILNNGGLLGTLAIFLQYKSYKKNKFLLSKFYFFLSLIFSFFDFISCDFSKQNDFTSGYTLFMKKL